MEKRYRVDKTFFQFSMCWIIVDGCHVLKKYRELSGWSIDDVDSEFSDLGMDDLHG